MWGDMRPTAVRGVDIVSRIIASIGAVAVFVAACGDGSSTDTASSQLADGTGSSSSVQQVTAPMTTPAVPPEDDGQDTGSEAETSADTDAAAGADMAAIGDTVPVEDAYLYLEEVEGEAALDTVKAWNGETLERLQSDPRFAEFEAEALAIVNASDKIAYGAYRGGMVYNFWQDETHVRGVLRRTSLASYASDAPEWDILLDVDALAEAEDANWVYKGSTCLRPDYTRCMLTLSDGGKDAAVRREWDHEAKAFVEGGFYIPEAKGGVTWVDQDTLLVQTDWGEGTMTESGYPFIVKRLARGQALEDAVEVLRGVPEDIFVGAFRLETEDASAPVLMGYIGHTFYEFTYYWLSDEGPKALPIPRKSSPAQYFKGQLVLTLEEDWTPVADGPTYAKGDVVSFDLKAWMDTGELGAISVVYAPTARSSVEGISASQSKMVLTIYENVTGAAYAYDFVDGAWAGEPLPLPDKGSVRVVSANDSSDVIFVNQESYIAPDTLWQVDVVAGEASVMKALPARFDADKIQVQQFEAVSSDGEKIPYFVMHPADMPMDGSNPTLLYGYGGFQISLNPSYSGVTGKLWVENGGVYVVANIRGGGEFGPSWHQAGLKTNRQIIYDDFAAVAEDLIARGITSAPKLGIAGGSNGGLLVGVAYTQRPELFNAVVCAVPLLDMLRYHMLLAGASWVGEYGDPDIPEERAFLEGISPYHNVDADGDYPTILFLTSTKDDRVHPGHARKMAALLAEYGHPFEYYENIDGGHSAAANLAEAAKRSALQYTFLAQQLMDE